MTRSTFLPFLLAILLVAAAACAEGDTYEEDAGAAMDEMPAAVTYDLTLVGDSTFRVPHGGMAVSAALLASDGMVIATMSDSVDASAAPAFSITFADAVTEGESYMVDYWIDSNFGEGATEGACDAPPADHQWRVSVDPVEGPVRVTQNHAPDAITDVCSSFSADSAM